MSTDWIDDTIEQLRRAIEGEEPQPLPEDGPRAQLVLRLIGWFCYTASAAIVVIYAVKLLSS